MTRRNPPKLPTGKLIKCEGVVLTKSGRVSKMKIRDAELRKLTGRANPKRRASDESLTLNARLMRAAKRLRLGQTYETDGRTWKKVRGKRGEGTTMVEVARNRR